MASHPFLVEGYSKTIASAATPVDAQAPSAPIFKYALDAVIRCPSGNTSDIKIGSRTRQEFTVVKGTSERLTTLMNRMSQSGPYDLRELFIKAGTDGDKVEILLLSPSNET
jgi:hypothetical protein